MRTLLCVIGGLMLYCQTMATSIVNIGMFWDGRPKGAVVSVSKGAYNLIGDGQRKMELKKGDVVQLNLEGRKVRVVKMGQELGSFTQIKFIRQSWGSTFNIKAVNPSYERRAYNDNLFVSTQSGRLKLINNVYLEHYIAGVVEAESGIKESFEYYKVQAIIARTYALSNLGKFAHMGFNLCDNVDCQVYKGKSVRNPDIIRAVNATKGLVLVDSDINLINAVFHSNSGGYTVNSEDAWSQEVSYLRSVRDSFSLGQPHYAWEVTISKDKWLNYLNKRFGYPTDNATFVGAVTNMNPNMRRPYLTEYDTSILLKTIRRDWGLKSTYFSIRDRGSDILLQGKGFGHGVGLSQEGAMKMANLGMPFNEILHFYYKDIHLIHLSALDFFRSE